MNDYMQSRGVALAILSNSLEMVIQGMRNTLFRSARSGVINSAHDFSCCVLSHDDQILLASESLPIHVMAGPDLIAQAIRRHHPVFRAGDAFLHNSPYEGNSHAADWVIAAPVLDPGGTHQFTVMVKAHQADCGNSLPTTYMATARDVFEEGALLFSATQVQRDYEHIDDILRMCRARIRAPEQWWGDYLALVGAARVGERRIQALAESVGWDELRAFSGRWLDYSEERIAQALRRLPSGRARASTFHDPFPGIPDGLDINVEVAIDAEQGLVEVDLTDNADCLPSGLNLSEAGSLASAMTGVFNSLGPGIPHNSGSLRRVQVKLRENCAVGVPRHPASCSVSTTNLAERVANAVQVAIASLADDHGMAASGYSMPPCDAVISGRTERGEYINQIFLAGSGGGASPQADGLLCVGTVLAAGVIHRDGIETTELRYPLRIREQRILTDSEGAGRRRGAPGNRVEFGPSGERPVRVLFSAAGYMSPANGAQGGHDGACADQLLRRPDGALEPLAPVQDLELTRGQSVISIACGGGGYGAPTEREPERVAYDVREGYITPTRARDVYAVELDERGQVKPEGTAALRSKIADK